MALPRNALTGAALLAAVATATAVTSSNALASPADATYTITVGSTGPFAFPTDTPAAPYLDKDGTFYFQQSASLYGATDPRYWDFFSGTDFDSAKRNAATSDAVNPANPLDRNNDTTWRCDNSPTGRTASYPPAGSHYAQKNYCDLSSVWVDPDTGDWYGLVHNEFTPQPFGDHLHYDAIDYTVSTDQGRTWTIKDHVLTSPYSTTRGDNAAFPNQTYYYGDGDQRLFVDTASGYFYVYYGSRIVDKGGSWRVFQEHVARAPIAGKMAPNTWQKWYNGAWSQPGIGGRESNMVPVDANNSTGYTPPAQEYNPNNTGTANQQVAAGVLAPTTPLFVMNISYDAYLGEYIGEPQAVDQSGKAPQQLYATDNLATQRWHLIGDTGSYTDASWYRWFLDSANKTNSTIVGKNFRSYCAFACSNNADGEYVNLSVDSSNPAPSPVDPAKRYTISNGDNRILAQGTGATTTSLAAPTGAPSESWAFTPTGDGAFTVTNAGSGHLLGVDSTSTDQRAWGTRPTVTAAAPGGPSVGQQWFVISGTTADGSPSGNVRLVNRYSGLVLGMSADGQHLAETTPTRTWTDATGSPVGGARTAAQQSLTLTPVSGTSTSDSALRTVGGLGALLPNWMDPGDDGNRR